MIGQGGLAFSYLGRLSSFLNALVLVKGTNERTSSRLRNALRAGKWVNDYKELARCRILWIAVSDDSLPRILKDLASQLSLSNRTIVLCNTPRDSGMFPLLAEKGAKIATLYLMPQSDERIFILEGDPAVVKELQEMLEADNRKTIELKPGTKPMYISGLHLCAHLVLPFAGAAVESFRLAGLTRSQATLAMMAIAGNALRSYVRGADKALPRAEAEQMQNVLDEYRGAIRELNPRMAELYDANPAKWFGFVGAKKFWAGSAEKEAARAAQGAGAS